MEKYDEDLYENPFFSTLQNQFSSIFDDATAKRWTICVPKFTSVVKEVISLGDVEDHILSPEAENDTEYKTWSGKVVVANDEKLELIDSSKKRNGVPILFEETFYNNSDESYRVLCIGHLMNRDVKAGEETVQKKTYNLYSYEECISRLFDHQGGKKTQENLDRQLESFSRAYPRLASAEFVNIVDAANAHFTKSMQTMLKDSHIRRTAQESGSEMFDLKLAVELYMMHSLHRSMFQAIVTNLSAQDAEINKMARNLRDVKPTDLGVKPEFSRVLKYARKELLRINGYSTPFGRLRCLKRVVKSLSESSIDEENSMVLTTDDFLPIMMYLIIKSEIPNWMANLKYMQNFHFSKCYQDDEYMFYLTTVEAALGYIKSGQLKQEALIASSLKTTASSDIKSGTSSLTSGGTVTDRFFQYVQSGDESAVRLLLGKPRDSDSTLKLCHPLCDCSKCKTVLRQVPTETNLVTAYTRDDRGYTALHIAAHHGQAHLVDLLIQHGAVVDASDYLGYTPLHLACHKGYQNIILLLIHFGADCTIPDAVGNTPLHVCADSGHEDCVKALVFTDVSRTRINIDAKNEKGDTSLHLAAKWGYENIVIILLENGANTDVRNRKKQLPVHVSQNTNVLKIFKAHDSEPKIELIKTKSESLDEYDVVRVVNKKRPSSVSFKQPSSPTLVTPEVVSLDQAEIRQLALLFKAIENEDIPLVNYYLNLSENVEDQEKNKTVDRSSMCHPLCQCEKCSKLQQPTSAKSILNINATDKTGFTPLLKATQEGKIELVSLFLKKGAEVNVFNHKKITPLHIACYFGKLEICSILLTHGADVDSKDLMGDTPLHLACQKGCDTIVDLLLKYCAKVTKTNDRGNSPLHIATKVGRIGIVSRLLDGGAYPLATNKDGYTPFDFTKDTKLRDLLNSHITKKPIPSSNPCSPTTDQPTAHAQTSSSESSEPISIKDLFAAFEEKNLQTLKILASSIKSFDAKESLRKTETNDLSSPDLRPLQHSLSIQKFDFSALRHVESTDKSDPLHLYRLSTSDKQDAVLVPPDPPDVISLSSDDTVDVQSEEDWVLPEIKNHSKLEETPEQSSDLFQERDQEM